MAFFGAAAAIYFAEVWYCRKHHLGFWHGADQVMWIFAFALGFGRIANFINGELYGNPTDGSWGVIFNLPPSEWVNGVNVPRHPVQLYSAVSHFILGFWILWKLRSKPRTEFDRIPGFTVFHFLAGYGILRFITDYWRHESIWIIPNVLHGGQLLSLALVVIAVIGARVRYRRAVSRGSVIDFYPPDGAMAPLPPECHAYLRAEEERAHRDAPDASVRPDGKGGAQTRSKSHGPKKAKKPKR
jgi:phosphatidylglycerol:prolipoprotein diacylglycerol transferase